MRCVVIKTPVINILTKSEVTLRLDDKLILRLSDTAKAEDMSVSEVVQMLLGNIEKFMLNAESDKPKWISVDYDLPPDGVQVLVYCNDGGIYTSRLSVIINQQKHQKESAYKQLATTHWQPLPDSPINKLKDDK